MFSPDTESSGKALIDNLFHQLQTLFFISKLLFLDQSPDSGGNPSPFVSRRQLEQVVQETPLDEQAEQAHDNSYQLLKATHSDQSSILEESSISIIDLSSSDSSSCIAPTPEVSKAGKHGTLS